MGRAIIGWQLYLGAAFIKLFGFSFTTVRMSSLLVAVVMAFILQARPRPRRHHRAQTRPSARSPSFSIPALPHALGHLHDRHLRPLRRRSLPLRLPPSPASFHPPAPPSPGSASPSSPRSLRHLTPDRMARPPRHGPLHPLAPPCPAPRHSSPEPPPRLPASSLSSPLSTGTPCSRTPNPNTSWSTTSRWVQTLWRLIHSFLDISPFCCYLSQPRSCSHCAGAALASSSSSPHRSSAISFSPSIQAICAATSPLAPALERLDQCPRHL